VFRLPYTTKITWDPVKDINYIINVTGYAFGIVVPSDGPIKSWADFVAYAKANPGKLSYGSDRHAHQPAPHHRADRAEARPAAQPHPLQGQRRPQPGAGWRPRDGRRRLHRLRAAGAGRQAARVLNTWGEKAARQVRRCADAEGTGHRHRAELAVSASARRATRRPTWVRKLHDAFKKAMEEPSYVQALARYDMLPMYMSSSALREVRAGNVRHREGAGRELGLASRIDAASGAA
jgi:hypothetical protein